MTESIVPTINMGALLGAPESNPVPASPLEKALATVSPEDASATTMKEVKFQFRDLLGSQQLADLKANAPAVATQMVNDVNTIIQFGEPVLTKLNDGSVRLLEAQREIEIPGAEIVVNDLLRAVDGYSAKYRNVQLETAVAKFTAFFKGAGYSLKTMVRESKPIADKIDMAAVKLRKMELDLADNVTRGQQLHKNTTEVLTEVVAVLAALEEIQEAAKTEFTEIDNVLKAAESKESKEAPLVVVELHGKNISMNELRSLHTTYANGISELEKTWFDWRQQFFLGYAQAPSILNIVLVSATMQRRCQVFRTMGLPAARSSLAMWQQAVMAKEGAKMGSAVQEGTNTLIQGAFEATGSAVAEVAMAAQTPVISEETIFTVINSVKAQCEGLVAADKWGREMRAKSLQTMEAGESGIKQTFTESRRALVMNAVTATRQPQELAPSVDTDLLGKLGVSV